MIKTTFSEIIGAGIDPHLSSEALEWHPTPTVVTDLLGVVQYANAALASLTGYTKDELTGNSVGQFSSGQLYSFSHVIREVISSREPWSGEWLWHQRSGNTLIADQLVSPLREPNGRIVSLLVTIQDTTGRRQVEALEKTTGAGVWTRSGDSEYIEASPAFLKLHGLNSRTTALDWKTFVAILHDEDRARVIGRLLEGINKREATISAEYRIVFPDGEIRWIETSADCDYDDAGRPLRMIGVSLDTTDRKRADLLAAEAKRDFERFFNLIPDLACIVSTDGYFKKVNAAWETLGYTQEEVLRTPMLHFVHPDDLERTVKEAAKQSPYYRTNHFVNRYRCKDGSYRLFDWTTTFNRDESTRFGVARDITEQRLWEESLKESEERFRIMADSCPTIMWVTDADGRIRMTNRTCREFLGIALEDARDLGHAVIHPEDQPAYLEAFEAAVHQRAPFRAEARIRRSDGEWRWIVSYAEPRMAQGGEFLGHVGISPDITDRKQTEVALQKAKDAAEIANRSKSEFLANMSHEIRTPMNGVIGLTDLTLTTELSSEQRGYLQMVKTSAESLLRILNDILDFSKIEAGKLELEVIEFDLRETVVAALKVVSLAGAAKDIEVACDIDSQVPYRVIGDSVRLQQILLNLTGNAIKFTPRGEVVVRVKRSSEGEPLHFSISDTGIGIPREKQQHIFSPFAQADASSTRKFGGTGLGLSISSQLIQMMGGRIWLESEEGKGSTFHFTVRLGIGPAEQEQQRPEVVLPSEQSVLVVDDNDTSRRVLDRVLRNWGLRTTLANSGSAAREALDRAAQNGNSFALVLADAHLHDVDALTLARHIKAQSSDAHMVLLTSGMQTGSVDPCRDGNISACLRKPVGERELRDTVNKILAPHQTVVLREAPAPAIGPASRLNVLVVEDNPVNRMLTTRLLGRQQHDVKTAWDGNEALEMIEREEFDCVLMDVQMPGLDGFETTAAIRAKELRSGRHLPIIALTAHAMSGDVDRCLRAGMDGYLSKPIKAAELFATIERVLDMERRKPDPAQSRV